ncbi:hypothetical protein ACFQX4_22660 [Roseomonas sp. GCM10028921]
MLAAMKALRAENTASREKARRFLVQEGVLAAGGGLAEPYRTETQS